MIPGSKFREQVGMRSRNIALLLAGLGAAAVGIVVGIFAVNSHSPFFLVALRITATYLC